jgi:seryl-tRNA synthetase
MQDSNNTSDGTKEIDLEAVQSDANRDPYETIELPKGAVAHIYDKLQELEQRVNDLEIENSELQRQNYTLKETLEMVKQTQEETVSDFEKQIQILKSQAGHLADHSVETDETIESLRSIIQTHKEQTNKRLAKIESGADIQEPEETTTKSESELDQIKYLDEETIESDFSVDTRRAVVVWKNFEEWSKKTPGGRTLKSGQLKKLLSSKEDTSLAWTQIYRVMACFNEKTPDVYETIEDNKTGKAIIKRA